MSEATANLDLKSVWIGKLFYNNNDDDDDNNDDNSNDNI